MFSRKKETKDRPRKGKDVSQFMPFDMPDINAFDATMPVDGDDGDDDDDSDLEAELLQLTSGNAPPPRRAARPTRPAPVPPESLDKMVSAVLKDPSTDEEMSGDDDDPELLNELGALVEEESMPASETPPTKQPAAPKSTGLLHDLEERLDMYRKAEKNAKDAGETLRARRFGRGIKTLADLIKQAKAGCNINEEDIPPPVVVKMAKKVDPTPAPAESVAEDPAEIVPRRPAPPPPPVPVRPTQMEVTLPEQNDASVNEGPSTEPQKSSPTFDKNAALAALATRRDEYKIAALHAKKAGDRPTAVSYVKIIKGFELVISAVENGEIVDLSEMPPPPPPAGSVKTAVPVREMAVEDSEKQKDSDNCQADVGPGEGESQPETDGYNAPSAPATVMEALVQRLEKYKSVEKAAQEEGNMSKARRIGRIVKQYENAIKLHKAGKPIPVDELPTPPGFAPIPQEDGPPNSSKAPSGPPPQPAAQDDTKKPPSTPKPEAPHHPQPSPAPSPKPQQNVRHAPQSRQEKQMNMLLIKQKQFKEAALQAKRRGETEKAKEYLRLAKGFDPLIEATKSGLPVDMETLPVPPDTNFIVNEPDFEIVETDDCLPNKESEPFVLIERALADQIKTCLEHRDRSRIVGDVANANKYEQLALHTKKDLEAVHTVHKTGGPLPKYHFEMRTLTVVECCSDLGDNDLELHIIRGMNYSASTDTYVKFEFPYPSDYPQKDRTSVHYNSDCPSYDQKFKITFQRNSRECQRVFKRKSLKCEVYAKGSRLRNLCCFCCPEDCGESLCCSGFLRADNLLGTATVKLQPLESQCIYLESFELKNGRRGTGAHLELKIRIRTPLVSKKIEDLPTRWIVIDSF